MTFSVRNAWLPLTLVLLLTACGGGGGGGGGSADTADTTAKTCSGSGTVTISGTATYDRVPDIADGTGGAYLDHDATVALPIRQATVEARCPDGSVTYASTSTGDDGSYSLDVPENVDVEVRVLARLDRSSAPVWRVRIRDNTSGNAIYSLVSSEFDSETGSVGLDLHADSGWGGASYTGDRAAGPFAILDTMLEAMEKVTAVDPVVTFANLDVFWSAQNSSCSGNVSIGCISTSYYDGNGGIYVLGTAADTDEYDEHVMVHEWGHYYEDNFSRSNSIGGRHSGGSLLDARLAFGEGWGNAWSGIALDDPIYKDTNSGSGFTVGIENGTDSAFPVTAPYLGWFSESAVQRIIYDLYDSNSDAADGDTVSLGFGPLHSVLTGAQKNTLYLTSIFTFIDALKDANPGEVAAIDAITSAFDIEPVQDEIGTGEDNDFDNGDPDLILPVYQTVVVDGGDTQVCSTNKYRTSDSYEYNRLGARRYVLVEQSTAATIKFLAQGSGGPRIILFENGEAVMGSSGTAEVHSITADLDGSASPYVLEVYSDLNTNNSADGGKFCFAVSAITQ
ncbi:MAG: hypothetical protein R3217_02275 [Gammaproteobacteria bacterium]|nr:hypothetical protein [Gammaproteobacteria bacterium]